MRYIVSVPTRGTQTFLVDAESRRGARIKAKAGISIIPVGHEVDRLCWSRASADPDRALSEES